MASRTKTTKSRTSKKFKQTKLKWWYILPVILIVTVAGYAIVRFSEAGSRQKTIYPFDNWSFIISGNTIAKTKKVCVNYRAASTGKVLIGISSDQITLNPNTFLNPLNYSSVKQEFKTKAGKNTSCMNIPLRAGFRANPISPRVQLTIFEKGYSGYYAGKGVKLEKAVLYQ